MYTVCKCTTYYIRYFLFICIVITVHAVGDLIILNMCALIAPFYSLVFIDTIFDLLVSTHAHTQDTNVCVCTQLLCNTRVAVMFVTRLQTYLESQGERAVT